MYCHRWDDSFHDECHAPLFLNGSCSYVLWLQGRTPDVRLARVPVCELTPSFSIEARELSCGTGFTSREDSGVTQPLIGWPQRFFLHRFRSRSPPPPGPTVHSSIPPIINPPATEYNSSPLSLSLSLTAAVPHCNTVGSNLLFSTSQSSLVCKHRRVSFTERERGGEII